MSTHNTGTVRRFAAAASAGEAINNRRSTHESAVADWALACASGDQDALELLALAERFASTDPAWTADIVDCGADERREWAGCVGAWHWELVAGDGHNNWGGRWFRFWAQSGCVRGVLELVQSGPSLGREAAGMALRAQLDDERKRWL